MMMRIMIITIIIIIIMIIIIIAIIIAECVRRVKKLCRSRLNGGNFISGINA